jgi:hypothetical protein
MTLKVIPTERALGEGVFQKYAQNFLNFRTCAHARVHTHTHMEHDLSY